MITFASVKPDSVWIWTPILDHNRVEVHAVDIHSSIYFLADTHGFWIRFTGVDATSALRQIEAALQWLQGCELLQGVVFPQLETV